jgi:hypothetical protein
MPTTTKKPKVYAVAMKDLISQKVFHVIVCRTEDDAARYCLQLNPKSKIEYKMIPDWDFVCEAVNRYQADLNH